MRVSIKKDDPGYVENPFDYSIFLNGLKILDCFTADEEQGIAYIYKRDCLSGNLLCWTGNSFLNYSEPMEGFRRGHVVIKKPAKSRFV